MASSSRNQGRRLSAQTCSNSRRPSSPIVSASSVLFFSSLGKRKSLKRFSYRSAHAGSMCTSRHSGATSESSTPRVAHGLSNTFEPTQRANGCQHVGRIGSLLATRFDPAAFPKLLDQTIKQTTFRSLIEQTTAKRGTRTEKSKPGSVNSRLKTSFQSMRVRTASAA